MAFIYYNMYVHIILIYLSGKVDDIYLVNVHVHVHWKYTVLINIWHQIIIIHFLFLREIGYYNYLVTLICSMIFENVLNIVIICFF